jgi:hypothetical protein
VRWWLVVLLLASVGLNVGLLAQRSKVRAWAERTAVSGPNAPERSTGDAKVEGRRPAESSLPFIERLADEVGLQGEPRRLFVERQRVFFDRTREVRQALRRQQRQFRERMLEPAADRAELERQLAELAASQQALEKAFVDNYFETRDLLDPEQRERFGKVVHRLRQLRWERYEGEGGERRRRARRERRAAEREAEAREDAAAESAPERERTPPR